MIDNEKMKYEVVCTQSYLDVGLLIETNNKFEPKRVLARASTYSSDREYGGVEMQTWVKTGILLSKKEWVDITYNKYTDQILKELGIDRKAKRTIADNPTMQVVYDNSQGVYIVKINGPTTEIFINSTDIVEAREIFIDEMARMFNHAVCEQLKLEQE